MKHVFARAIAVSLAVTMVTAAIAGSIEAGDHLEMAAVLQAPTSPTRVAQIAESGGGHWQNDVLIGWALGTGVGIWAARRDSPLILGWLPGGFQVGFIHRF